MFCATKRRRTPTAIISSSADTTHEACEAQILPNLRVLTGGAKYPYQVIQRVLTL